MNLAKRLPCLLGQDINYSVGIYNIRPVDFKIYGLLCYGILARNSLLVLLKTPITKNIRKTQLVHKLNTFSE